MKMQSWNDWLDLKENQMQQWGATPSQLVSSLIDQVRNDYSSVISSKGSVGHQSWENIDSVLRELRKSDSGIVNGLENVWNQIKRVIGRELVDSPVGFQGQRQFDHKKFNFAVEPLYKQFFDLAKMLYGKLNTAGQ